MDFLNAFVALMNFVIIPATAYGAQLALGALGVTLIYGILRFSNFAHGDTMAFGAMVTILFTWGLQAAWASRWGRCPRRFWRCPSASLATGLLVLGTDRVVYRFYRAPEGQADHLRHRLHRGDVHPERHRALHHRRG
jgi:branched-chain amino acid transport system permease protein